MTLPNLLIQHESPDFQKKMEDHLGKDYRLIFSGSHEETLEALYQEAPDMLWWNPLPAPSPERDVIRMARQKNPDLPVALVTATNESSCFSFLREYGLGAALSPSLGIPPALLRHFAAHVQAPGCLFDLSNAFPDSFLRRRFPLPHYQARLEALDQLMLDFQKTPYVDFHDLQLVYEEVLNNAFFHAFRDNKNQPKYRGDEEEHLEPQDQVICEWHLGETFSVLSIQDNMGLLARHEVWDRFDRQLSLSGLLDTSGRGLYLTHLLCRMMTITIQPGKKTQVNLFFCPGESREPRPISLQVDCSMLQTVSRH